MAVAAVALLTTAGAACGGDGGGADADDEVASLGTSDTSNDGSTDESADEPTADDREDAMLAFAECMREQGIDMPDPQIGENGETAIAVGGEEMDVDEFEAANEVCQPLMDEAMGDMTIDPERQAEMEEQMLEYAQCMRDHGIDMEDPQVDGGRVVIRNEVADDGSGDDADFQAANEACVMDGQMVPGASPAGPSTDSDRGAGDNGPSVVIRTNEDEG